MSGTQAALQIEEHVELGTMWELFRTQNNTNDVNVSRPFRLSMVREQWTAYSAECVGTTSLNDDDIQRAGKS